MDEHANLKAAIEAYGNALIGLSRKRIPANYVNMEYMRVRLTVAFEPELYSRGLTLYLSLDSITRDLVVTLEEHNA